MKLTLNSNIFLSPKGTDKIALIDVNDASDTYIMIDGELAVLMKDIFLSKQAPDEVLERYSKEDLEGINEFINDLVDAGVIVKS
jgi:aminoglycoside/choline kinase family phosphotransferase